MMRKTMLRRALLRTMLVVLSDLPLLMTSKRGRVMREIYFIFCALDLCICVVYLYFFCVWTCICVDMYLAYVIYAL